MTIDELLTMANQCLVKLGEEDGNDYDTINVLANTAQACASVAQAMCLAQMTSTGTDINGTFSRWLRVDTSR